MNETGGPASETIARLEGFLSSRLGDGQPVRVVEHTPIVGGYSRTMARFTVECGGQRQGFVSRADPPPGESILDTDRAAEWAMLSCLCADGTIPMPAARWFDPTGEELGSPAIILDLVDGQGLPALIAQRPEEHPSFVQRLAGAIGTVHSFDTTALPPSLERPTSWEDYMDEGIERWPAAEGAHAEHDPFMRLVAAWLRANRPPPAPLTLVHGDFQAPNLLVERDGGRFLLIDWELTHIGDPREDLGWWVLAHKSQPPDLIDNDSDAFFARYRELTGFSEDVVNPQTVAYFTVMASANVFMGVINQTALMARGESTAMSVGYMTNAIPFMHGVWIDAMRTAGAWTGAAR